jgi:hypothetical protein
MFLVFRDLSLEERDNQLLSLTSGYKRFLLPFSGNTSINLRIGHEIPIVAEIYYHGQSLLFLQFNSCLAVNGQSFLVIDGYLLNF